MKNKIDRKFEELKKAGRHGLMAHVVVGYPNLEASQRLILTLAEAGADLIEMQIPFTDPLADGPTILLANLKALEAGTKVSDCFRFAEKMASRLNDIPLLFMTYINIPFNWGLESFCRDSAAAGVSGLIVPDIPPEEKDEAYHELCLANNLHPIYILSPSSTAERMRIIGQHASGFLYCTARVGITGAREHQIEGLKNFIGKVRREVRVPLALGFGLSSADQVRSVSQLVEVSVIGSKVIDIYNAAKRENEGLKNVASFLRSLR
ncbi:MAG: tryptophan synthase subunit alpha [Deltaproteobacteria bacterium]|nr:MAG: tryptophan synthase subunit alpha [Deltaproteobacteria bacterium]